MIRVLIIADSAATRIGLQSILVGDERFETIVGEQSLNDFFRRNPRLSAAAPDAVLAELDGRGMTWFASIAEGAASGPLVLLADELSRSELLRALHLGARAVLPRSARAPEILAALEAVAVGLTAFGADEFELLFPAVSTADPGHELAQEELTPREVEVLALMAQGLANKNIADRLKISEHTVKFHVSSILSKLAASSRTDAVTRGLKSGLLVI